MRRRRWLPFAASAGLLLAAGLGLGRERPAADPLRFPHGIHVIENEMDCAECHGDVMTLAPGARATPGHDVCGMCHDVEEQGECGTCHLDPENPAAVPPVTAPASFAHELHDGLTCDRCHGMFTAESVKPALPAVPDCRLCHGEKDVQPSDHDLVAWRGDHGLEAAFGTEECAVCHTQASCDECHQGVNLYGSPHPVSWAFNHGIEAAWGGDCLACHETRETCTSCHRATLPVPHAFGPAWANAETGGDHSEEAAAFPEACITCHDLGGADPTCARCHE